MTQETKSQKSIWQKLMEIQRAKISFAKTESSGTKSSYDSSKASYSYTPGWEIVEAIRKMMDERNLMMPMNVVSENHEMVERTVYKVLNGEICSFQQRMNHSVIKVEYFFIDTGTGERTETFTMFSDSANGLDKSTATALAFAERNIFLKMFHITTKDKYDEPDAQDGSFLEGLPEQPRDLSQADISAINRRQRERTAGAYVRQQPAAPAPAPVQAAPPQYRDYRRQPSTAPVNTEQAYKNAVETLMNFDKSTNSHQKALCNCLTTLNRAGYPTADPNFINRLVEEAQAKRENRQPNFNNTL